MTKFRVQSAHEYVTGKPHFESVPQNVIDFSAARIARLEAEWAELHERAEKIRAQFIAARGERFESENTPRAFALRLALREADADVRATSEALDATKTAAWRARGEPDFEFIRKQSGLETIALYRRAAAEAPADDADLFADATETADRLEAEFIKTYGEEPPKAHGPEIDFDGEVKQVECDPKKPMITMLGDLEETEVRWLIPDFLEEDAVALIVGQRSTFKSFLALDRAMRVAAQGKDVLIISAEGSDLDRRAEAWIKRYAPGKDRSNFRVGVIQRRLDMANTEMQNAIREQCKALGLKPSLYVLDTYSKLRARGSEENSNDDAKAFVDCIAQLRGKASVLIVTHSPRSDSTRARGASALGDDTEAEFVVSKEHDGITVTRERFKQSPSLPPLHFRTESVDLARVDSQGRAVTSLVLVESADRPVQAGRKSDMQLTGDRVLEALGGRSDWALVEDIRKQLCDRLVGLDAKQRNNRWSGNSGYIRRWLQPALDSGEIEQNDDGTRVRFAVRASEENF